MTKPAATFDAYSPEYDDFARRGDGIYAEHQAEWERNHTGKMVAIHPDTADYAIGEEEDAAIRELRARRPKGLLYTRRIGPPTAADMRLARRMSGSQNAK